MACPFDLPMMPCLYDITLVVWIKWMQHQDFSGGHSSPYYYGLKVLNFRVLMEYDVVALV